MTNVVFKWCVETAQTLMAWKRLLPHATVCGAMCVP